MSHRGRVLLERAGVIALVAAMWIATAEVSSTSALRTHHPTHVWLPAGLALGITVLAGEWAALGVWLGALVFLIAHGEPPGLVIVVPLIEAGEAALGAYLLLRVARFHPSLDRVRDVIAMLVVSAFVSLVAASATVSAVIAMPHNGSLATIGRMPSWTWSHLSAQLILTPLITTFSTRQARPSQRSVIELAFLAVAVLAVSVVVFDQRIGMGLPFQPVPFYLFPLLVWTGLRYDPRVAAAVNAAIATAAFGSWMIGVGPFDELTQYQGFVMVSGVTTLVLSALRCERTRADLRKTSIQESALDAIVTTDKRGVIVEFNPAAATLFGISATEALGRDVTDLLIAPSLREKLRESLAWHTRPDADGWVDGRVRYPLLRADGMEFPAEIALTRSYLQGEIWFTAFVRDITAESQAEAARRESRELLEHKVKERTAALSDANDELKRRDELLHQAQALARVGSFDYDFMAERLQWSDELARILGRDPATVHSLDELAACLHPDDRTRVRVAVETALLSRQPYSFEARVVRPDGSTAIVQSQGRVYVDEAGQQLRVTGYAQDITEREHAEEARRRLVHLVESSADAIFALSLDGRIQTWNAAASRIFGYAADEVVGKNVEMLVADSHAQQLRDAMTAVSTGQTRAHYELRHRRRDGSVFDASVTMSVILDDEGRLVGLSKVLRDITDQKLAEQRMLQSLREKEILLREIHHRVKNNLQVITSLLNLQMERVSSAAARSALTESQDRIRSMAFVHQLLYKSKDLAHIDFLEYLRNVVESLVASYRGDQRAVHSNVGGVPIQLDIDRAISSGLIVTELVTNALRHAFPQGRAGHISVQVSVRDEQIVLEVSDDGVGLPDQSRLDASPTFGLQIARALTQQLEGTLDIDTHYGTAYTIKFPQNVRTEAVA
jgi:PAS domain S-box-containing protein